jgi:cytoskeletal protein CcmA (bactofilin family)
MSTSRGLLVVRDDLIITGTVANFTEAHISGYVEGELIGKSLRLDPQGKAMGTVRVDNVEVHGLMQGTVVVNNLLDVRSTGVVNGRVQYGRIALEHGANLSAELRNVPPTLGGDLNLVVSRGRSVRVTEQDITAFDPDDKASDLTFTVSNIRGGRVVLSAGEAVTTFTLQDLKVGAVVFRHDGGLGGDAAFDVVAADKSGATSGKPQTVTVSVMD